MNKKMVIIESAQFKPTWLMIKLHIDTGLLYFCKTNVNDPIKYTGSGNYWRKHIKKHGKQKVITVWYHLFCDIEKLVSFALKFSEIFNIVESVKWANQTEETGLDNRTGTTHSKKSKELMSVKRREHHDKFGTIGYRKGSIDSLETRLNKSKARKKWVKENPEKVLEIAKLVKRRYVDDPSLGKKHSRPGELNPMYGVIRPQEWKDQHSKRMMGEGNPMYGKSPSNKGKKPTTEQLEKMRGPRGKQKNPAEKISCPHCEKMGIPTNMKRWHFDNCKLRGK